MKNKNNYYLLSLGIAIAAYVIIKSFSPDTWYATYLLIIVLILFYLLERLFVPKVNMEIEEKWGEYTESKSGITWCLARKMNWHAGTSSYDSRIFLEDNGFVILGIADQMLYVVEPPEGWFREDTSNVHTYILDEKGKKRFMQFCKTDFLNPEDYRAFLNEKVD